MIRNYRNLKKSLKIPKGYSETVNRRRRDNTMNGQRKRVKGTNNNVQKLHRKLNIEQHESHLKPMVN
jgi:hypothetical protein